MVAKNNSRIDRPHHVYELIETTVANFHPDLVNARFLAVWKYNCKPDIDEWLFDGNVRKANSVERDAEDGYDLVIYLNYTLWNHPDFGAIRQNELLDRIMASIDVKMKDGEPVLDGSDREIYRTKKPEFVGYFSVLNRHGLARPEYHKLASIIQEILNRGAKIEFEGEPIV